MPPKKKLKVEKKEADLYSNMAAVRGKFKEPVRESVEELVFEDLAEIDDPDWAMPQNNTNIPRDEGVEAAAAFLDQNRDVHKDAVTISDVWNMLDIACKYPQHHALTTSEKLPVISSVQITAIEACLLTASPLPCVGMFSIALQEAVQAQKAGKGPSFIQCLTWLAFAVQTPVVQIIPAGEFFLEVDKYTKDRLIHPKLTEIDESERADLVITNTARIFEYLTACDLSAITDEEEKAILLYAISRIILDKRLANLYFIQNKAVALFSHVLSCSEAPRSVIWEFGQLLPKICDDYRGHRMILDIVQKSESPFPSCICLLSFIFLRISERGECAKDIMNEFLDEDFAKEYAETISDMIDNVMEVYSEKNRHQQEAVLSMLASSLHPNVVHVMSKETYKILDSKLRKLAYDWNKAKYTDDQILNRLLVSSMNILNEKQDRRVVGSEGRENPYS